MKKNRMLAGILATLMVLVAIPMIQVSAEVPTAPETYLSDNALLNAYELDYLGAKLSFKEGFTDSRCKWTPTENSPGTVYCTDEDGLVLDGNGTWSFALDGSWCAMGENTTAIMFTLKKDVDNTGNLNIFLPYSSSRTEHFLINSDNTFQRHYDDGGDVYQALDGNKNFACSERRYMIVRIGTEKSHLFVDRGDGTWLPFGPGMNTAFEDKDTPGVMGATGVPGEYTRGTTYSTAYGSIGFVVTNRTGKTYIKNITVYSKPIDCDEILTSHPTSEADLLTYYNMEVAKKIDFSAENFASSADAQEVSWSGAAEDVVYTPGTGATIKNGTLVWNNGSDEWTSFGADTRAIAITLMVPSDSSAILNTFLTYDDGGTKHFLYNNKETYHNTNANNGKTLLDGAGNFSPRLTQYLVVEMGEGRIHLYRYIPDADVWRIIGEHTGKDAATTSKGVVFQASGGGDAIVKDITLYTALPTPTAPLELRDGVGGKKIGDSAETATQPTKLQASLFWGLDDDATLVIAGYDSAKNLKKVEIKKKSELTDNKYIFDATTDSSIASVKVFLWDGFTKLSPLAGNKEVKVSTVSQ